MFETIELIKAGVGRREEYHIAFFPFFMSQSHCRCHIFYDGDISHPRFFGGSRHILGSLADEDQGFAFFPDQLAQGIEVIALVAAAGNENNRGIAIGSQSLEYRIGIGGFGVVDVTHPL